MKDIIKEKILNLMKLFRNINLNDTVSIDTEFDDVIGTLIQYGENTTLKLSGRVRNIGKNIYLKQEKEFTSHIRQLILLTKDDVNKKKNVMEKEEFRKIFEKTLCEKKYIIFYQKEQDLKILNKTLGYKVSEKIEIIDLEKYFSTRNLSLSQNDVAKIFGLKENIGHDAYKDSLLLSKIVYEIWKIANIDDDLKRIEEIDKFIEKVIGFFWIKISKIKINKPYQNLQGKLGILRENFEKFTKDLEPTRKYPNPKELPPKLREDIKNFLDSLPEKHILKKMDTEKIEKLTKEAIKENEKIHDFQRKHNGK